MNENTSSEPEFLLTLNPQAVIQPLITSLKECSESILFGLKSIDKTTSLPDILTEEDSFFNLTFAEPESFEKQKIRYKEWLILKGFEELIEGVKLTLIEAYHYVTIYDYFRDDKSKPASEFKRKIDYLKKESSKLSLPSLLEKVQEGLTEPLIYEQHVISLNKVRNCLVHRKGIVSEKDIVTTDNTITVLWVKFFLYYEYENKQIELSENHIVMKETPVKLLNKDVEKKFVLDEKIIFTYVEFKQLMTTFFHFANDLNSKLPRV